MASPPRWEDFSTWASRSAAASAAAAVPASASAAPSAAEAPALATEGADEASTSTQLQLPHGPEVWAPPFDVAISLGPVHLEPQLLGSSSESDTVEVPNYDRKRKRTDSEPPVAELGLGLGLGLGSEPGDVALQPSPQVGEAVAVEPAEPPRPLCVICRQPPWRPQVSAMCGHFACDECWGQWVCVKFECPVCRAKVRPTNLIQLRGWGEG